MAKAKISKTMKRELKGVKKSLRKEKKRSARIESKEKKEIKGVKKSIRKEKRRSARIESKAKTLSKEFAALKENLSTLRKKGTKKKQLSEYNLFMRRQLQAGKTFKQAVKLWKMQQRFMKSGGKLRRRVVVKKVIRRIVRPKIVKKIVVKRKKKNPKKRKIKKPTKRKRVKKRTSRRRKRAIKKAVRRIVRKAAAPAVDFSSLRSMIQNTIKSEISSTQVSVPVSFDAPIDFPGHSDEESALKLTRLYFRDIARLGFKRNLELDAIINAYLYALSRLKRKGIESREILEALKKDKITSTHF
ncbi:MAG: hypothetical protein V1494_06605 [Candidatus Diapherotrites archaeon]